VSCQNSKENSVNSTSDDDKNANKVEVAKIEKETKKAGTDISMDSTKSYCYIKNIFEEDGKTLLSVDFIQMIDTNEGGGYDIINQNPKLRTFILNSSTTFLPPNDLDVERIKRVLKSQTEHNTKDENKDDEYYQRFEITVKDGFVLELLIDMAG
jgi:hypothetical protein